MTQSGLVYKDTIKSEIEQAFDRNLLICKQSDSKIKFHAVLQRLIKSIANRYGLQGIEEYNLNYKSRHCEIRNGLVDVVWLSADTPIVAVEIDSSYRQKSITKLETIEAKFKFWVYYGKYDVCSLPKIPDAITVIRKRRM